MSKEIELKYRFDEGRIAQFLNDTEISSLITEPMQTLQMESVYYDTPTRVLQDARITFRKRRENDVTRFTVKTSLGLHERGEWEVLAETVDSALPLLAEAGAPMLPPPPYQVCAKAEFVRRFTRISPRAGVVFELCIDVGTLGVLPFCELELELKQGNKEDLEAFGAQLAARFGLVAEPQSKFMRAKKFTVV